MLGKIARALLPGQTRAYQYSQGEPAQLAVDADGNTWIRNSNATITRVQGDTAHNDADAGDPVKIGGRAEATPGADTVADGDRVDASFDRDGRLRVSLDQVNIENANLEVHLEATNVESGQDPDSLIGFGTEDGTLTGAEHALRVDSGGRLITTQSGNASDSWHQNHGLNGSEQVKASAGTVWEMSGINRSGVVLFAQLWDGGTSGTLRAEYRVPPNENFEKQFPRGRDDFSSDITIAASETAGSFSGNGPMNFYVQFQ